MAGNNEDTGENSSTKFLEEEDRSETSEPESDRDDDEKYPTLEPVYDGKQIEIDPKLVENGLSAISFRRLPQGLKLSRGTIQERNTFYNIHQPDLKKLSWVRKIPEECRKEAIEKMFLEIAKENVEVNDHSTELSHQPSSMNECHSTQNSTESSKTTVKKNKETSNSVNNEKSCLVLIMAPVQMQDHSDESVIRAMNDMREACSFESQEKRISREAGGGEEGEFEDKTKLCHAAFESSAGPTKCS
ncbi:hypothetical protein J437_LFUL012420 [Ladona fulva]|uniref:Uncharacterized protein n=1 Tax=Ladona fulva TaxID=123851 RepID=A0A8K0P0Q1_LADFU|nr:hypothetical protein J437_LFUL012420 [Ladona fulva]